MLKICSQGMGRLVAIVCVLAGVSDAAACPFCSAESRTLTEETQTADAVVLARFVKEAAETTASEDPAKSDPNSGMATFAIVEALRGAESLTPGKEIQVVFFGEPDRERVFLISGIGTERIDWTTPLPLSPAGVEYVRALAQVPASGVERLAFFQGYLEHEDPLLAQDAYDEFARAPYPEVQALKPRMNREQLLKWIDDREVSPSRRRLYLTMLGICGERSDVAALESLIASDFQAMKPHVDQIAQTGLALGGPIGLPVWAEFVDQDERRKKLGLDALVACYLTLNGADGLKLIEDRFLKNPQTEYTYIYSTIMALRFHGEEPTSPVPRDRLLASMRLLLDNSEFADQVIPDLARWEDWSVLDRLVAMYKASDKNGYVRQPVVTYLTVAGDQPGEVGSKAQTALAELEQLDPEGVKQARSLMAFGALGRARASSSTAAASQAADTSTGAATSPPGEFAATPAEIQAANEAKPGDFPDPAEFVQGGASANDVAPANGSEDPAANAAPAAASEAAPTAQPVVTAAAQSTDVTSPATGPAAAAVAATPAPVAVAPTPAASSANNLLVVGVPLVAAVALLGIYWVMLRSGVM